jgi:hypothetical protein
MEVETKYPAVVLFGRSEDDCTRTIGEDHGHMPPSAGYL